MPKKEVTLKHISQKLNVSVQTVSKALRGLPGMSEETRQRICRTARQLNYITIDQEQSLLSEKIPVYPSRQKRFVFVLHSHDEFNHLILHGLQEKLNEFNHIIETIPLPQQIAISDVDEWIEQHTIPYADGMFIAPRIAPDIEEKLLQVNIPRVLINFPPTQANVDSVVWDVQHAVQQSVYHLKAKGHARIMFVGNATLRARGYRMRMLAFQEAMYELGEEINIDDHMTSNISDREQWLHEFQTKMEKLQPTALLNSIEFNLPFIYYSCIRNGFEIPQDYSLISLETNRNSLFEDVTRPILHLEATGYRAAERMLWRIGNPDLPYEHIRIQGSIHEGQTVRNIGV